MKNFLWSFIAILILVPSSSAQVLLQPDPCGFPDTTSQEFQLAASGNWGYGYDTLLYDLGQWKMNRFVTIDSAGSSVQNRTLFVVTIRDTSADPLNKRQRVWMHARTHPGEVQGTWVVNEIIKQLLADTESAKTLRQRYIFNIMPMINPDGVEIGNARENANMIDIESNWNNASPQKEVIVLRSQFQQRMAEPNPMRIMLNLHSAYSCKRYFVYHAPGGTTPIFAALERRFINYVRTSFPNAIEPHTYFVSWTSAPALQYPESWCWSNHKEKIMAITYEDGNCASASKFDSTARAILKGIDLYLQDTSEVTGVTLASSLPVRYLLYQNYPNPFNPSTTIEYELPMAGPVSLRVYDVMGREVSTLSDGEQSAGRHSVPFEAHSLSSGIYFYQLRFHGQIETKTMHLIK